MKFVMKKVIFVVMLLLPLLCSAGGGTGGPGKEMFSLAEQYRGKEGFEIVKFSRTGMFFLKKMMRASLDKEEAKQLSVLNDIERMLILEYGSAAPALRKKFSDSALKILGRYEALAEIKSDGETVRIYGEIDDGGGRIGNPVIFTGDAVICLFGKLNIEDLGQMTGN